MRKWWSQTVQIVGPTCLIKRTEKGQLSVVVTGLQVSS